MNEQSTAIRLTDIAQALGEPFPIEAIELLPKGSIERDGKTLCMAMPYADPRVYQDRLNKLVPGEWSTPPPIALTVGNKLVCYVTVVVCGIPHTDVGEADPSENQGTVAFAQAFKRACSQFGLGRYLYNLEKAWVPYNPKGKRIDLDAAGICQIVRGMYQKAGISLQTQGKPPTPQEGKSASHNGNASSVPPQSQNDGATLAHLVLVAKNRAKKLGLATSPETWEAVLQEATGEEGLRDEALTLSLIARINGHLTGIERKRKEQSHEAVDK